MNQAKTIDAAEAKAKPQPDRAQGSREIDGPASFPLSGSHLQPSAGWQTYPRQRAVQRMLASSTLQAKLTVGAPDDIYEKEAEEVARHVSALSIDLSSSSPESHGQQRTDGVHVARRAVARSLLHRVPVMRLQQSMGNRRFGKLLRDASLSPATPAVMPRCTCGKDSSGECEACRAQRLVVQRAPSGDVAGQEAPPIVHEVLTAPGQPLAESARQALEPAFGYDFSQVSVHHDTRAAESASAVNALAYTVGNHIVFNAGQYAPGTSQGNHLLAHELTHTIQQTGGTAASVQRLSWDDVTNAAASAGQALEQGAAAVTSNVVGGVEAAAKTVESGAQALAQGAEAVGQSVVSGAEAAGKAIVGGAHAAGHAVAGAAGAAVGGVAAAGHAVAQGVASLRDPEKLRGDLLAKLNSARNELGAVDPGSITINESQASSLNQHIFSLNAAIPSAAIPLVGPATAGGATLAEILEGIGAAVLGASVAEVLLALIIIAAIILLIMAIVKGAQGKDKEKTDDQDGTKEKDKNGERDKTKEEEEEEEERKKKKACTKPLFWDPTIKAENSQPGVLEPCFLIGDFSIHGHHTWPKFAGGLVEQPLMGVRGSVHISLLQPQLDAFLLLGFKNDGLTREASLNGPFIARLRTDKGLRRQMVAALTGFYAGFSTLNCDPGIPPVIYGSGIGATLVSLGGP